MGVRKISISLCVSTCHKSDSHQVFRLDHIVMKIGERQTHFLSHDPRSRLLCRTLLPRKKCKIASVFYEKDQTLKPVKLFPIFMDVEVQGKVQWGFDLQNVWKKEKRVTRLFFIPPNGSIKRAKCKGVLQNVWRNSRVSDPLFSMGGKIFSFIKCNGALQNIWRKKHF